VNSSGRSVGQLFATEVRSEDMAPEQRQQLRQDSSQPVLNQVEALLLHHLNAILPQSAFGKALQYLRGQWPNLVRVGTGVWRISIDLCENATSPFTVGRDNWRCIDTVAAANVAVNLYSLVLSSRANSIDPTSTSLALFRGLPRVRPPDDYEGLLPWKMAAKQLVGESQFHLGESLFSHPGSRKKVRRPSEAEIMIEGHCAHPGCAPCKFGTRAFGICDAVPGERDANSAVSTLGLYGHATRAPRLTAAFAAGVTVYRARRDELPIPQCFDVKSVGTLFTRRMASAEDLIAKCPLR
jgi:hypothetical protein